MYRNYDDLFIGVGLAQLARDLKAGCFPKRESQQDDVGCNCPNQSRNGPCVGDGGHDFAILLQDIDQHLPGCGILIGNEDAC